MIWRRSSPSPRPRRPRRRRRRVVLRRQRPIGTESRCLGPVDLRPGSLSWGHITATPKPGWCDTDVAAPVGAALGVPVAIDTHVRAAAIGEQRWGDHRRRANVVLRHDRHRDRRRRHRSTGSCSTDGGTPRWVTSPSPTISPPTRSPGTCPCRRLLGGTGQRSGTGGRRSGPPAPARGPRGLGVGGPARRVGPGQRGPGPVSRSDRGRRRRSQHPGLLAQVRVEMAAQIAATSPCRPSTSSSSPRPSAAAPASWGPSPWLRVPGDRVT